MFLCFVRGAEKSEAEGKGPRFVELVWTSFSGVLVSCFMPSETGRDS